MRTGNAGSTHTAGNNRRVRGHTAASRNQTLGSMHTADIFRRSFQTNQDNFFALGSPSFGIFSRKDGLTDGSARRSGQTGCDYFFRSFGIQHRVQQLIQLIGADAHNSFFFGQHAFFIHFNSHADSSGRGAFAVAALQHPQFTVFNGKFHILHIFVVSFEVVFGINQFFIQIRHQFFQRIAFAFRRHRLRGTNTGHNVFTLGVNQIFAVINVFTGRGVAREADTGSAVIAGITEDHGLYVNGCTPVTRNIVQFAVSNGFLNHPGLEHGADTGPQLFPRILRNDFVQSDTDFFIFFNQFFQIIGSQICIGFIAFGFFHSFQSMFKFIDVGFQNYVGIHHQETTIRVIGKSFVIGSFGQTFNGFIIQTEVQNGIHHTGHRNAGAGTNREEQRVVGITEFFAHNFFNTGNGITNLIFQIGGILMVIVVIVGADFGRNRKSGRHRQTDLVHFRKVGTFTAQEISHRGIAFGFAVSKCIYPFTHGSFSSYSCSCVKQWPQRIDKNLSGRN